jgi:hypothetical protein
VRGPLTTWLEESRFPAALLAQWTARPATDGYHSEGSGITLLRWQGLELSMNWAKHRMRNSADRCAPAFAVKDPKHPLRSLNGVGGSNYAHPLGQSIVMIDEERQNPVSAELTSVDIEGSVQHVQATSDKQYPGATITRTFAVLGPHALIVDRVRCDKPRLVDWWLRYPGGNFTHTALRESLSLATEEKTGFFREKPPRGYKSPSYFWARTDGNWQEGSGRMTFLGTPGTEVYVVAFQASYAAWAKERETGVPVLMLRRRNVKETDFVVLFSGDTKALKRAAVTKADGTPADAIGVRVTLADGQTFHAVVNYEPKGAEVVLGDLRTKERFATDYRRDELTVKSQAGPTPGRSSGP